MSIIIRCANFFDIPRLEKLEEDVWGELGTEVYRESHFHSWLETYPNGFWVAEIENVVVGYAYAQLMNFSLEMQFQTCNVLTDYGYTRTTHELDGDSVCGVSILSCKKGAGKLLIRQLYSLLSGENKKCYFGFSRITGFGEYLSEVKLLGRKVSSNEVALWYVHESARLESLKVWSDFGEKPTLDLPPILKPDPVLNWHLRQWDIPGITLGVLRLMPNFIQDPQSLDYAVLICSEFSELF